MGQKTHPKGFRLITTQNHLSNWHSNKLNYSKFIKEEFFIRKSINIGLKDILMLSNIAIERVNDYYTKKNYIDIKINALYPRIKDIYKKLLAIHVNELTQESSKYSSYSKEQLKNLIINYLHKRIIYLNRFLRFKTGNLCSIKITFFKTVYEDAFLIAQSIGTQLEKRIPFRRVLKQTIKKAEMTDIKGIKIQLSGRLNGIEIARSEWKRYGKIPLHTLTANIDYCSYPINTRDGVIGIKVWLLKN